MGLWRRLAGSHPRVAETRADGGSNTAGAGAERGALLPPARSAAPVTSRDALSLSTVYRAVSIRATAARQLGIDVYRGDVQIATPAIIRQPDLDISRPVFVEQSVTSLNLAGNAFWRVRRNAAGAVASLEVLNPHDVTIETTPAGRVTSYEHRGHKLKPDEVKHLARLRIPGSPYGLGPIQAASAEIRGALDLRDYSANWIGSGDVPSGIISSDQQLTPDDAAAIKQRWADSRGGTRSVAVFGAGAKYSPVILSPADAQFLESQRFSTTQVARLFGVPASLMLAAVEGNTQTYANVEQDWLGFVRFSLMEDLTEIEDALTTLLPRGQRARFNIEALLRSDTTTRYQAHAVGLQAGFLTVDEVRAIENLPPLNTPAAPAAGSETP